VRHALGVDGLLPDGGIGRAAADREVVALDDGAAAVDAPLADDRVRGEEVGELTVLVVGAAPGESTGLVEAARVEEAVDPLANRQPARSCCLPTRSSPPMRRASSSCRRSSSSSGSQDTRPP
jgi:hypothetical protein